MKDLRQDEIDIYHRHSFHEIPLGIEKSNIKSIVTIHDLIFTDILNSFLKLIEKYIIKNFLSSCVGANKIIAHEQTKLDIINFFEIPENKIEVVYQGCNYVFQNPISSETRKKVILKYKLPKNFILYVSSIDERKNLMTILKSIRNLKDQNLVIIGDGNSYKKKCIKYINQHQISERVHIIKNISLEDISVNLPIN